MEDSGQRKRRLEEMRMQAELAETTGDFVEASGSRIHLSNPLIESSSSTMPSQDVSHAGPRFDFYTDPMAAFSSNKKKNNVDVRGPPDYSTPPNFGSSAMEQFSSPRLPPPRFPEPMNPQMPHSFAQGSPAPYRNPVWNGPRGSPHYDFPPHPSSGSSYRSPGFETPVRPLLNSAQHISHRPTYSPNPSPRYSPSPNHSPRYSPSPNHSPRYSPSPGRGRSGWYNTRGGGRQHPSSPGRFSDRDRPCDVDRFYKKSMVEDPWQFLKPVLWKVTGATSNYFYVPSESSSIKKGGPSGASVKPSSQSSLAEYLAAAFNETVDGTENV